MRSAKFRPKRTRRIVIGLITALFAYGVFDYISYHARLRRALNSVFDVGGRAGSLGSWPLGQVLRIKFERPLNAEELHKISVLNELRRRHLVGVMFDCDMTPQQSQQSRDVLHRCHVFNVSSTK